MNIEILKQAIEKWGESSQIEMIMEECLELAMAINKLRRKDGDPHKPFADVHDEIADVKIMIAQAELIFDKEEIDKRVAFKMERLEKRISK